MTSVPAPNRPKQGLRASLSIRADEKDLTVWMIGVFAVTQASHALGANAADALFFVRFGVEELPLMILLAGPAVMALILAHMAGLGYRGSRRWLPLVTLTCAALTVVEWASVFTGARIVYAIIWISTQVVNMVMVTVMWNAAGAACTTRQAKRLFPLFASAAVAGGLLANLLTGPLAALIGTETLLLVQGTLLLGSVGLLRRLSRLFREDTRERASSIRSEMAAAMRTVRSSRLLRLAAVTTLALSVLFFLVVFPFSEAVALSFDSEARVAGFLGYFSAIVTAITFFVSLLITKRLFARLGIVISLMIVPIVYALGFALWLGAFDLATAVVVRGLQWIAITAIGGIAFNALFNVLTGRRRGQVLALLTAVPSQLGTILAGLILIAGETLSDAARFGIGLAVSLGTLALVISMRPAYVDAIVTAVRQGLVGMFDVPQHGLLTPEDREMRRVLEANLKNPKPEARVVAVSTLARFVDPSGADSIEPLLEDEDPMVRSAAFDSICVVDPGRISKYVLTALADPASEVRAQALRFLGSQSTVDPGIVSPSLSDPDPMVRSAAALLVGGEEGRRVAGDLLASDKTREITAVLEEMKRWGMVIDLDPTRFLHHPEPAVRVAAVGASAGASVDPAMLIPGLEDSSLKVRSTTAELLARDERGRDLLLEVLNTGSVSATDAALRALTPVNRFVPDFLTWADVQAARASRLASMGRALAGESGSSTSQFLVRVLQRRSATLSNWVLLAMTTRATEEVMPVVLRGVHVSDSETRAQAIEALEAIGDRSVVNVLLPLLEAGPDDSGIDSRGALRELSGDSDPWLRALAIRCLFEEIETDLSQLSTIASEDESDLVRQAVPSLTTMPIENIDSLSLMDRVLALQRVLMFSDLDPEDLESIAKVTAEVHYSPDESVYIEGEEGLEMTLIIKGAAIVSRDRDGIRHEITRYGEGEHVGELALLRGGQRSTDVRAGDEGLHGLVINKADLLEILEERPSVTMGMLSTLTSRLAEQT